MNESQTITVYGFQLVTAHAEVPEVATYKATAATVAGLGGEILEGTAEDVPTDELDESGCFRRLATGWGNLA